MLYQVAQLILLIDLIDLDQAGLRCSTGIGSWTDSADLLRLVRAHGLDPHLYADDTQIYGFSCQPV